MKISYNWLQGYFDEKLPTAETIENRLGVQAFEPEGMETISNDTVLDFDVLPNRAHDCLCHRGIAREVSAIMQIPMKTVSNYTPITSEQNPTELNIDIQDTEKCRRYSARVIRNIEIKESPQWIQDFLISMGQRPINNIVDATNVVLFDLGQPMHVFDFDKLASPQLIVRTAKPGEHIITLSGEEIELTPEDLVIADDEQALAIAGVKGGKSAEVDSGTTNIVLESANFHPVSTRKTSRRVKIQTDSSKRYENELTPELTLEALDALTALILENASTDTTVIEEVVDAYPNPVTPKTITVTLSHINSRIGTNMTADQVAHILDRLAMSHTLDSDTFTVDVPHARIDMEIPEDVIEDIARIYGFENIEAKSVTSIDFTPAINKLFYFQNEVRKFMISRGFTEVMTYSFRNTGEVSMTNALASDKQFLRTNLREGISEALDLNTQNAELFGETRIRVFELGRVFSNGKEINHFAIGIKNKDKSAKKKFGTEDEQMNTLITELNTSLGFSITPSSTDGILELSLDTIIAGHTTPDIYSIEANTMETGSISFTPFSPYPYMLRDIAVWSETDNTEIENIIREHAGDLLIRFDLFDEFSKDGKTSYAYKLVFQSMDRTLTDIEVGEIMENITGALNSEGFEVR